MARRRRLFCCKKINPLFIIILGIIAAAICMYVRMGPVIRDMAEYEAKIIATKAINDALAAAMKTSDVGYEELAVLTRNSAGNVTSIQANMPRINTLGTAITGQVIKSIEDLSHQAVDMPAGTLIGSRLLSGRGPSIKFYVIPTGYVQSNLENRFESAGINQTLHRIMLNLEVGVMGVLPGYSSSTFVSTEVCLAETIIIGVVPEYFTQIDGVSGDIPGLIADYGPTISEPNK